MTIGIDASRSAKKLKTGTETYSTELIQALSAIDKKNEYILYSPINIQDKFFKLGPNFRFKIIPFGKFWTQIRLSWEMLFGTKPDLLFVPAHTLPLIMPKKSVVTLHDLGFKHFPKLYSKTDLLYHNWATNHSLKRASHIITISQYSKNDIVKYFKIDPGKITVIYEGFDREIFKPQINLKNPKRPYILFIGRLEEKKNIVGMLKAYNYLRQDPDIKHQFILAGSPGYGYNKIQILLDNLDKNIRKDIILPGYVMQNEYIKLLKSADILFFASFFEGFGLPPLEAMASGIPVVASNTTSIPEVCANAALLVNPNNPPEMAKALRKILIDKKIRNLYIRNGLKRANQFSWQKCATETLKFFENI